MEKERLLEDQEKRTLCVYMLHMKVMRSEADFELWYQSTRDGSDEAERAYQETLALASTWLDGYRLGYRTAARLSRQALIDIDLLFPVER